MLTLLALVASSCSDRDGLPVAPEAFPISLAVNGIGVSTRSEGFSPLTAGTRVRVLAFRRAGVSPDPSVDDYMGEGTYAVAPGEDTGVLGAVNALLLRAGTYDFYALTPDLAIIPGNDAGGHTYTVEVGNGMDYATSLTQALTVSETAPLVSLNPLVRRCSKLTFALSPKGTNITAVDIASGSVTNLSDPPVTVGVNAALDVSSLGKNTEVSVSDFFAPDPAKALEQEASTVVLPRESGALDFKLSVAFNGSGKFTGLSAPLPSDLAFSPGIHYTFTVKMKGEQADLVLGVALWTDMDNFQTDMGGPGVVELLIGSWTDVHWESGHADTGGNNTTLVVSGWEANPVWSDELGRYPGLGVVSTDWQDVLWSNRSDTGGTNTGLTPGGWNDTPPTDNTNGGDLGE